MVGSHVSIIGCSGLIMLKTNHVVAADRILDGGFLAKASSLKPKPSLLCLQAQMNARNVSWVDNEAKHYFLSLKLTRSWGLSTRRARKPIHMRFGKDEPHETNEVALHVAL